MSSFRFLLCWGLSLGSKEAEKDNESIQHPEVGYKLDLFLALQILGQPI